jgi:hypothetical protein
MEFKHLQRGFLWLEGIGDGWDLFFGFSFALAMACYSDISFVYVRFLDSSRLSSRDPTFIWPIMSVSFIWKRYA